MSTRKFKYNGGILSLILKITNAEKLKLEITYKEGVVGVIGTETEINRLIELTKPFVNINSLML